MDKRAPAWLETPKHLQQLKDTWNGDRLVDSKKCDDTKSHQNCFWQETEPSDTVCPQRNPKCSSPSDTLCPQCYPASSVLSATQCPVSSLLPSVQCPPTQWHCSCDRSSWNEEGGATSSVTALRWSNAHSWSTISTSNIDNQTRFKHRKMSETIKWKWHTADTWRQKAKDVFGIFIRVAPCCTKSFGH